MKCKHADFRLLEEDKLAAYFLFLVNIKITERMKNETSARNLLDDSKDF
jgi:hypothetical protein